MTLDLKHTGFTDVLFKSIWLSSICFE